MAWKNELQTDDAKVMRHAFGLVKSGIERLLLTTVEERRIRKTLCWRSILLIAFM